MTAKKEKATPLDLKTLNLQSLTQLKQELDQDIDYLGSSLQQLQECISKCHTSEDALDTLGVSAEGKEILVPLTNSMYVKGKLIDVNKTVVNIGTGYYVEKNVTGSKEFFKRKIEMLKKQVETVQKAAQEKVMLRDAVMQTVEAKVQAALASGELPQVQNTR